MKLLIGLVVITVGILVIIAWNIYGDDDSQTMNIAVDTVKVDKIKEVTASFVITHLPDPSQFRATLMDRYYLLNTVCNSNKVMMYERLEKIKKSK